MSTIERDAFGMYMRQQGTAFQPTLMGASALIGEDVYNEGHESLGDIKEIVLNMSTGEVAYAVLSFGGFLGMGEKLFAVPWWALSLDAKNKRFILRVSKEKLKKAPGFDQDDWPEMADPNWLQALETFYTPARH